MVRMEVFICHVNFYTNKNALLEKNVMVGKCLKLRIKWKKIWIKSLMNSPGTTAGRRLEAAPRTHKIKSDIN